MTAQEFFGEWYKCLNQEELDKVVAKVREEYRKGKVYPDFKDIFAAFKYCDYNNLKVVFIGMDPYPDGAATGIAFANAKEGNHYRYMYPNTKLSPSLQVIKNCLEQNYTPKYMFDTTLHRWEQQGVLLLNSSLTVAANKPGSHTMLWRKFMCEFLKKLSEWQTGIVYVLMGEQAKSFKPYIGPFNDIIVCKHPAYYARTGEPMPNIFGQIDKLTWDKNKLKILWL